MEKTIIATLNYFQYFDYAVSLDEIYWYLTKRIDKKRLDHTVEQLLLQKKLFFHQKIQRYTLGGYSIDDYRNVLLKQSISQKKLIKIRHFVKWLSVFTEIKLIGISGSLAMKNAKKNDDIDLFIITARKRLWTGRLLALFLAQVFRIRRKVGEKSVKDKVCLNLFFDEADMKIARRKQNIYVAHEVLQMKPLVDKDNVYQDFLKVNNWVYRIFPNYPQIEKVELKRKKGANFVGNLVESFCKIIQMLIINKHRTGEMITDSQLWFFPDDFEKKLIDVI